MSELSRCAQCGAEYPTNVPAGLCPSCLLQAGLASQVSESPAGAATNVSPRSSGFVPPTVPELAAWFPQLEVLELLGKGGMGAVYKARQPKLDRLVAIKILPHEISDDPSFVERFEREARTLARLNHPNIVSVYDFGETAELCYIVMEFIDGANLRQALRDQPLAPAQALAIVPQICEALQFAHDEGIVHRDIKPENILIDKRGRVKIADFGLAKLLGTEAADHSLTATHQVMGTLRYMAPEQMQGSREVDHRADIYSLGVVFYELLTGELPLGKFPPPSEKVRVDVRLDEIVLHALERDADRRYQHVSQVRADVEKVTSTAGVKSPAVPIPETTPPAAQPEEDEDEESDNNAHSWAALVGSLIPVVAVLLFFFNPWGMNGWYGFAAFCVLCGWLAQFADDHWRPLQSRLKSAVSEARAPRESASSGSGLAGTAVEEARRQLRAPAIALMVYGLALLFPALLCFTNGFDVIDGNDGLPAPVGGVMMIAAVLIVGLAGLLMRGGWHMLAFENYRTALRACLLGPPIGLWGLIVLSRPEVKAAFTTAPQAKSEPRLSRCALIGALWAPLFFIAAGGMLITVDVIRNEQVNPMRRQEILAVVVVSLGALAPFVTTTLGAVAIGQIKRSEGQLFGLRLAVVDVLFFPLLTLFAAISIPLTLALHSLMSVELIAVALPSVMLALIVCLAIAVVVWCRVIPDSSLNSINVRDKLRIAGVGLLIAGIMDAFAGLIWCGHNVVTVVSLYQQAAPIHWQLAETGLSVCMFMVVYYVVGAGLHFMKLEDDGDYTFSLLIAALTPPGFLFGFPAALYAFMQITSPEAKALFPGKLPDSQQSA